MPGESILIVDDKPENLKLARVLLRISGYEVATASNAKQTLSILETFRPRLILMDIQLPDMDGLELTRKIKSDPANAGILVLAVTAYAMKGDEEKALSAGCDGYVTKPIDTVRLPILIQDLLAAKPGPKQENTNTSSFTS
ncbi:MAG: two-component hybrid sensor and regulator [Fibrobacteres bacterium]|nr:two-component hybrid sensor and regulator [Fibrobacterota bacterium]